MINKEMIEEAAEFYDDENHLRFVFKEGANWAVKQITDDAVELLDWIVENGWWTTNPMWCNGEGSSDCDGGKSTYTELTSQELYQIYLNNKIKNVTKYNKI